MNIRRYSKAIAALMGSIATFLVSVNAPPQWQLYAGGLAALLTTVATFGVPNAAAAEVTDVVVTNLNDIQVKLDEAKNTAASNLEQVTQSAVDSITRIQKTIGVPDSLTAGSLVDQVLRKHRGQ